jgi:phosphoribosylamine--glycine ligase
MNITVIGNGGREQALKWKLETDGHTVELIGATNQTNVEDQTSLVIVGPEAPLADGIVDRLAALGIPTFGPTKAAAQLEASKAFAKQFMARHGVPTARFEVFDDYSAAINFVHRLPFGDPGCVIKASGLAAGKGVVVCDDVGEADFALTRIMIERAFGDAGNAVVIEERLSGPEVSLMAFCDGGTVVPMLPAQDHKRVFDDDKGPNTGGMGAFCPSPLMTQGDIAWCRDHILLPTVRGMAQAGVPYEGVLYAGLMLTPTGPMTLEFNCRFGDPETQVVLPLLETDLVDIANACIDGRLHQQKIAWRDGACACVVLASGGYPGEYAKGVPIQGLADVSNDVIVYHAGTRRVGDGYVTDGGRVLGVTARGATLREAIDQVYVGLAPITFEGMHYRRDIGQNMG